MNVLRIRYGLNCSAQLRRGDQYRIYISSDSMLRLQSIVGPYMHESISDTKETVRNKEEVQSMIEERMTNWTARL
jgi:hypothetical protein